MAVMAVAADRPHGNDLFVVVVLFAGRGAWEAHFVVSKCKL